MDRMQDESIPTTGACLIALNPRVNIMKLPQPSTTMQLICHDKNSMNINELGFLISQTRYKYEQMRSICQAVVVVFQTHHNS